MLWGLAVFALGWIILRAALQSITIDEADSFMIFARGDWPGPLYPSSGNHVLNTLLSRWSVACFGLSELSLRVPAILGAALYISASYSLCRLISSRLLLQAPLFISLVYNPFVMDYLTTARGYSLALGLLITAIGIVAQAMLGNRPRLLRQCTIASACVGLSFTANFSFAFVDLAVISLFCVWIMRHRGQEKPAAIITACALPGLLAALLICGYTLWHWPPGQLFAGATSLSEMFHSVVADSFDGTENRRWLQDMKATFAAVAVLLIPVLALDLHGRRRTFFKYTAAVLLTALTLHWAAFQTAHLPLPKDRTAVFLAPLITLLFGTALAARLRVTGWLTLATASLWFLSCLRLGYFKEWRYNSDSRQLYQVLHEVNQRCGVKRVVTAWFYVAALNFYRARFHDEDLDEFIATAPPFKGGQPVYVLYFPDSKNFIKEQRLKMIYYSTVTQAVIAVGNCPLF